MVGQAALSTTISSVLATATSLLGAGPAANEANTKQHLIDRVLAALGWNIQDWQEVDREFKVYDGTFLDYALRIDGKPKVFVEAKAVGKNLSDNAFIAQTVNYANNEGVVWCVLTNGLVYQIYKSNEPVQMDRKMLLEVDLREATDEPTTAQVAKSLAFLSRSSVESGELDRWGEVVFTDIRTRGALAKLAKEPPTSFVSVVSKAVEGPKISDARLRASLARVLGPLASAPQVGAIAGSAPAPVAPTPTEPKGGEKAAPGLKLPKKAYDVSWHTSKKAYKRNRQ